MAKYILLMASKGGVGKSSICKQIARELYRIGHKVQLEDYDPQQHLARFSEVNSHMRVENGDFVVIDTQGAHTETNTQLMEAMKNEDALIIIPFRPTEDDYIESLKMRDRLKHFGLLNKSVFVVNGAYRTIDKDAKYYSSLLEDTVTVSKSLFTQRKSFAKTPDSKVIGEISGFINEHIL